MLGGTLLLHTAGIGTAFAADDLQGHWAQTTMKSWADQGLINGYGAGVYKPNQTITRAEMTVLVNKAFGFGEAADLTAYRDVGHGKWYVSDVAKAVKAGYMSGYPDGTFRPEAPITRQELAAIATKLLKLDPLPEASGAFSDMKDAPAWSKGVVGAVYAGGLMVGQGATFRPLGKVTRAEAVVALDKAKARLNGANVAYDRAGTFGPPQGVQTVKGNVAISAPGVTLQNLVIEGDLLIDKAVGEGDVTLRHVSVKGKTTVQGGGANSVHLVDSVLVSIVVDKQNGTVRIVADGASEVASVDIRTSAKLEEAASLTGSGFADIGLNAALKSGSEVSLVGKFGDVDVYAGLIKLSLQSGSVQLLQAHDSATSSEIRLGSAAEVVRLLADAIVKVLGEGGIGKAEINISGVTLEKKPGELLLAPGVQATVAGQTQTGAIIGGGGGGTGSGPAPDTTAPTVTGVVYEGIYDEDVTPASTATDIASVELVRKPFGDAEAAKVEGYTLGTTITADVAHEGDYTLTVRDHAGNATIVVFRIDVVPAPTGVANEVFYKSGVTPGTDASDIATVRLWHQDFELLFSDVEPNEVTDYELGDEINAEGVYYLELEDLAGNVSGTGFAIDLTAPESVKGFADDNVVTFTLTDNFVMDDELWLEGEAEDIIVQYGDDLYTVSSVTVNPADIVLLAASDDEEFNYHPAIEVWLRLDESLPPGTGTVTVTLDAKDAAGNVGTNVISDIPNYSGAPTLLDAVFDGNEIALTYDQPLMPWQFPETTDFQVTVDWYTELLSAEIVDVTVMGNTVYLTLKQYYRSDSSIMLDYTPPAENPLVDYAGVLVSAIDSLDVDNITDPSPNVDNSKWAVSESNGIYSVSGEAGALYDNDKAGATAILYGAWIDNNGNNKYDEAVDELLSDIDNIEIGPVAEDGSFEPVQLVGLSAGTYHFNVTVIDNAGNETYYWVKLDLNLTS